MLPWILCFIRHRDKFLMLLRTYPPNRGLYNGVGGKIKPGETPLAACLREVREETGIHLTSARFGGTVTWQDAPETGSSGMYVYVVTLPDDFAPAEVAPCDTPEGRLEWLHRRRVRLPDPEVVDNIWHFVPEMFRSEEPYEWFCSYFADGQLVTVTAMPLPVDIRQLAEVT